MIIENDQKNPALQELLNRLRENPNLIVTPRQAEMLKECGYEGEINTLEVPSADVPDATDSRTESEGPDYAGK